MSAARQSNYSQEQQELAPMPILNTDEPSEVRGGFDRVRRGWLICRLPFKISHKCSGYRHRSVS